MFGKPVYLIGLEVQIFSTAGGSVSMITNAKA